MEKLSPLNTREVKPIKKQISEHWGCDFEGDYFFFKSAKDKVYILGRDADKIDLKNFRIDTLGMYFARVSDDGIRLSFEGSQVIGKIATKNVLELDEHDLRDWMRGEELDNIDIDLSGLSGYVIIKHGNDFFGCGKVTEKKILNFVPKIRRMQTTA
ncbi:hypothetical protein KY311_03380 [Candidatus Woesearchaeota archaeon]|nr:hypothetical protein [Candidatus Woesearchaeota archaeon]